MTYLYLLIAIYCLCSFIVYWRPVEFPRLVKLRDWLDKTLFYDGLLVFVMETYMELLIVGMFQVEQPIFSFKGEQFAFFYGSVCFLSSYIIMPIINTYLSTQNIQERLEQDELFEKRFSGLYEGMKTNSTLQKLFNLIYCLRLICTFTIVSYCNVTF